MLSVLSPAKSLDYETPLKTAAFTQPALLKHSGELVKVARKKSPAELGSLMNISDSLAELNFERFVDWQTPFNTNNARQALLAFDGDVYAGMDAPNTFDEADFQHAQTTLLILSGLYGVLRPLDLMMPYRLEMGTKLRTDRGNNLYDFWANTITGQINEAVSASPGDSVLINLASNEYFKSVKKANVQHNIVSPAFLDAKDTAQEKGDYKIVSFFAKKARGAMVGWLVKNRAETVEDIASFDGLGYKFSKKLSGPTSPTFIRRRKV